MIDRCLKKNPADRYASAAEVREALKTIMRTKQFETGMPFELPANVPPAEQEKRSTGVLSMLAERFRESADEQAKENSILVLPFRNFGKPKAATQQQRAAPILKIRPCMASRWRMRLPRGWRVCRRWWCGLRAR